MFHPLFLYCPVYILPHWEEFKSKVQKNLDKINERFKSETTNKPVEPTFESYKFVTQKNPFYIYNENGNKIGIIDEKTTLTIIDEKEGRIKIDAWLELY